MLWFVVSLCLLMHMQGGSMLTPHVDLRGAGINKALKKEGVTEGDTVLIGEAELAWSHNQTEAALYEAWLSDRKAKGKVGQGQARWPHQGGG